MKNTSLSPNKPFAEVIESSLHGWLAQSWQWDTFPSFGSIVTIQGKKRTHFGIVHQIQTGSMDPVRYPFPYQKTEEELLKEQPQIFEFLKTTFSCLIIGYQEKGSIHIKRLLEDSNFKMEDGRIVAVEMNVLAKMVEYYRKKIKKDLYA